MDRCLSPAGRKPFTEGLGLEDVGVKTDNRGRIEVDDHFNTSVKVPRHTSTMNTAISTSTSKG